MTNEQAIKLLHRLQDEQFDGEYGDERREALEMAVRALEGYGDLISRKAALEKINKQFWTTFTIPICKEIREATKDAVKQVPSAQPEIIYCQECTKADLCAWRREGAKYCSYAERRTDE